MSRRAGREPARGSDGRLERVEITDIAAGGAGVGRLADGRVAFTHRTAPGDTVDLRVTSTRKRWAKADLVGVRAPGPGRRHPPCPLYSRCGGCTLQHLDREAQLRAKASIVGNALRRIGGVEIEDPDIIAGPNEFEYRNRVSFHLRRLDADRVIAGFHELERPDRVLDVDDRCLLPEPSIREAWRDLRREWGGSANRLPSGESLRLTLQSTATGEVGLLVEGGFARGKPEEILERVPRIVAIWMTGPDGETRHLAGRHSPGDAGGPELEAGVFTQVNREVSELLEAHVRKLAGDVEGIRCVDAYCGIAARAVGLAKDGARVTGIEADARAVEEARRRTVPGLDIVEGLVEVELAAALPADLLILNPPRAGVDPRVCDTVLDTPPARLIYVSCDPATLARDCARLASRYTMDGVRCFDMFPQTAHVETVVDLRCATG